MQKKQTNLLKDDLCGKVVLVTGGGSGIGAAIAEAFGRHGAKVGIHHYRSDGQDVSALVERIRVAGGEAVSIHADFSTSLAVAGTIEQVVAHFGRLDILLNNAGSMVARRHLEALDDDFITQVFDLNARSVVTACRTALPHFINQGGVYNQCQFDFCPDRWQPRIFGLQRLQGLCQYPDPLLGPGIG